MIFAIFQLVGGIILSLGWIPQIIQIFKTKSVSDFNLKTFLMIFIGIALMEVYAINLLINGIGIAFFITNTFSFVLSLSLVILIIKYR